jgi:hypothetical protein
MSIEGSSADLEVTFDYFLRTVMEVSVLWERRYCQEAGARQAVGGSERQQPDEDEWKDLEANRGSRERSSFLRRRVIFPTSLLDRAPSPQLASRDSAVSGVLNGRAARELNVFDAVDAAFGGPRKVRHVAIEIPATGNRECQRYGDHSHDFSPKY